MNAHIRFNGNYKNATIDFVTKSDFAFLRDWRKAAQQNQHPIRRDAAEFATLACERFKMYSTRDNYAQSFDDITAHIKDNPHSEVAALIAMRCDWFPDSNVLGIAHFRRSWCNNIILDYLASHPCIAKAPVDYPHEVGGVGTSLLYFLCQAASKLNCKVIWGEATQNSCELYKSFFQLESVSDLLYIPSEKFVGFVASLEKKWAGLEKK